MKSTNIICLLLAVAGLSFGIGQSVGQAAPQQSKVLRVSDRATQSQLYYVWSELHRVSASSRGTCQNVRLQVEGNPDIASCF